MNDFVKLILICTSSILNIKHFDFCELIRVAGVNDLYWAVILNHLVLLPLLIDLVIDNRNRLHWLYLNPSSFTLHRFQVKVWVGIIFINSNFLFLNCFIIIYNHIVIFPRSNSKLLIIFDFNRHHQFTLLFFIKNLRHKVGIVLLHITNFPKHDFLGSNLYTVLIN